MAALVRIVNAFFVALFVLAALVSVGFLIAATEGLGRGPEAVWLSLGWAGLMAALALLCFLNMRARLGTRRALTAANVAALIAALAGLVLGGAVIRWIAGVSLLPFAVTLLAGARSGRKDPA